MMNILSQRCLNKSLDIGRYLESFLKRNNSFKIRSFYGESFTLSLLFRLGILNAEMKKIILDEYIQKDKKNPEFHFEFNNYAFNDYITLSGDSDLDEIFRPLKFKGTSCTNWTLLRSNVRLKEKIDEGKAIKEALLKINNLQEKSGLILDDPGVKSFQYHCFSSAMLIEIYETTKDKIFFDAFLRSVEFIRCFILENGEALYIGRGQEQSFGLGVLVYILSQYVKYSTDQSALSDIDKVLTFVEKFQRDDGSFPLVFTGLEAKFPENVDMSAEKFCGWYPYNNFFDYLPFLGFFLHKSHKILETISVDKKLPTINHDYCDNSFLKIVKRKYTAIVSLPGGYWSNDLPIPLIYSQDKFLTPMLGGEQFQTSLYHVDALSMPMTKNGWAWRKYGRGFLYKNSLIWISLFGILKRNYFFEEEKINITHDVMSWIPSNQHFSVLKDMTINKNGQWVNEDLQITFSSNDIKTGVGFSAMGKLKILKTPMKVDMIMELKR